jgi:hypothetical protein
VKKRTTPAPKRAGTVRVEVQGARAVRMVSVIDDLEWLSKNSPRGFALAMEAFSEIALASKK